jgi:hypothetical protein
MVPTPCLGTLGKLIESQQLSQLEMPQGTSLLTFPNCRDVLLQLSCSGSSLELVDVLIHRLRHVISGLINEKKCQRSVQLYRIAQEIA